MIKQEEVKDSETQELMPIEAVDFKIKATNSIIKSTVNITYISDSKNKIEAILEMPTNPDIVISKMKIKVGEQVIIGEVKDKEKAKEKYEDAIARGDTASLLQTKDDDEEILQLTVGNILPQQVVDVKISFIEQAQIFEGAYLINIPSSMMLLLTENRENSKLSVNINTTAPITSIFCPKQFLRDKALNPEETTMIQLSYNPKSTIEEKEVSIYYKTNENDKPQIIAQKKGDEVAIMVSVLPTFSPEPQESNIQIQYDEMPEETDVQMHSDKHLVVFIVDRSGSMSGSKMDITKEALLLFLKSLPQNDTLFEIVSFGSGYTSLTEKTGVKYIEYNQDNLEMAVNKLNKFQADMGGTEIYKPLQKVLEMNTPDGYAKHVFLLTDGQTDQPAKCIKLIEDMKNDNTKIHSFGIGNDCDKKWCEKVADIGGGVSVLLEYGKIDQLRKKVIEVLSQTMQPCLKDVITKFELPTNPVIQTTNYMKSASRIYRNHLYTEYFIVDQRTYEEAKNKDIQYEISYVDPVKNKKTTFRLQKNDIKEVDEGSTIQKMAAHFMIKKLEQDKQQKQAQEISIKYQVLAKNTAIIGVIKQADKSGQDQELKSVSLSYQDLLRRSARGKVGLGYGMVGACRHTAVAMSGGRGGSVSGGRGGRGGRGGMNMGQVAAMPHILKRCKAKTATKSASKVPGMAKKKAKESARSRSRSRDRDRERGNKYMAEEADELNSDYEEVNDEDEDMDLDGNFDLQENNSFSQKKRNRQAVNYVEEAQEEMKQSYNTQQDLKNRFNQIIKAQQFNGSWNDQSLITSCVPGFNESQFKKSLLELLPSKNKFNSTVEIIWVTVAVLILLNWKFKNQKDEWQLIAKKAKKYLANLVTCKPETILASLKL